MFLIELLLDVFGEALIQLVWEALLEFFFRTVPSAERPRPQLHPALALLVYAVAGVLIGWLTVAIYPHRLLAHPRLPGASLVISPLLAGGVMAYLGRHHPSSHERTFRLDRFSYGFVFALGISGARFFLLPK